MTALAEGTIPITAEEREALDKIEDLVGFTREGELLQAETRSGETYLIHSDGTPKED